MGLEATGVTFARNCPSQMSRKHTGVNASAQTNIRLCCNDARCHFVNKTVAPRSGVVGPVWTPSRQTLPDAGSAVISTALTQLSPLAPDAPEVGKRPTAMVGNPCLSA